MKWSGLGNRNIRARKNLSVSYPVAANKSREVFQYLKGEWPEQNRIHHRERRDGCANSHRERDHGHGEKAGRFSQAAQTEAQIPKQIVDPIARNHFAALFFETFRAAEFDSRTPFRFRARQSSALEFLDVKLNMRLKFILEIALRLRPARTSKQATANMQLGSFEFVP